LEFIYAKYKISLAFVDIMSDFPRDGEDTIIMESFQDEHIFLISSSDPWYEDILIYLQILKFSSHYSWDKWHCIQY
jgi:hypothetical protein